jgi:hypothetical protein
VPFLRLRGEGHGEQREACKGEFLYERAHGMQTFLFEWEDDRTMLSCLSHRLRACPSMDDF